MADFDPVFRRQFLLTPEPCPALARWRHGLIGNTHLYAHPDLELSLHTTTDGNRSVALLGYMLDPDRPQKTNRDLVRAIASIAHSTDALRVYLNSVAGRFVLVVLTPEDTFLFHDPCGLRSVCFTRYRDRVYAASQPNLLGEAVPLAKGERHSSYTLSAYARTTIEHWIPSGCSLFEEVSHLAPNHYLRFSTLEQVRYWPTGPVHARAPDEASVVAGELLRRLMTAAGRRFPLALPLTAGWDSRLLLGAAKDIARDIWFYTLQYRSLDARSDDIRIPVALLRDLGLGHTLIDCRKKKVPAEFGDIYRRNGGLAHLDDWGEIAFGMSEAYPAGKLCVKGSCAEIARCWHYSRGDHPPVVSPDQILALEPGWETLPFIRGQVSDWFGEARRAAVDTGMDILDLFYWEQRMGSWQAQGQLEWDIVQEVFCPFNHRGLLEVLLGVPARFRCASRYPLFRMILEHLWPEVLSLPINPEETRARFVERSLRKNRGPAGGSPGSRPEGGQPTA